MDLLAPVGHSGDARPRLSDRDHRRRTRHHADAGRADPDHRQRAATPDRRADPATPPSPGPAPALVHLATPSPSQSPPLSLPTPRPTTLITNYGCRISGSRGLPRVDAPSKRPPDGRTQIDDMTR